MTIEAIICEETNGTTVLHKMTKPYLSGTSIVGMVEKRKAISDGELEHQYNPANNILYCTVGKVLKIPRGFHSRTVERSYGV
jgi:hypothetical protein